MELKLNFKPLMYTDENKVRLLSRVEQLNTFPYRVNNVYYENAIVMGSSDYVLDYVLAYNIQKFNKKVIQERDEHNIYVSSTIVSKKNFVLNVYKIPIELLKLANLVVIQHENNFSIEPLSKKK